MSTSTSYNHLKRLLLRGGRLTKWKGSVASIAPDLGSVNLSSFHKTTAMGTIALSIVLIGAVDDAQAQTVGDDILAVNSLPDGTVFDALAGNDTVTVSTNVGISASGTVTGGADNDAISLTSGSDLGVNVGGVGAVLGDTGSDTITLVDSLVGRYGSGTVSGGDNADIISLSTNSNLGHFTGASGSVQGDAGDDTITITGSQVGRFGTGTVSGGDDNDSITLTNSFVARETGSTGEVLGDAGQDTITLDNTEVGRAGAGTVSGGSGADNISLSNASHVGVVTGGTGFVLGDEGDDTITVDGSFIGHYRDGTVSGGDNNDNITLTNVSIGRQALATGVVTGDAGQDTITLSNTFVGYYGTGSVSGGAGADNITLNNGSILGNYAGSSGSVSGDAGNDTITIENSSIGRFGDATVSGGDDNDTITLSNGTSINASSSVLGDAGNDTINIDDTVVRTAGSVIDGGADTDLLVFTTTGDAAIGSGEFLNFEELEKGGDGTLTISADIGIDSSVTVSMGVLDLVGSGALSATTIDIDGGTLQTDGGGLAAGASLNAASGAVFDVDGDETVAVLNNNGGTIEIADSVTLSSGVINLTSGELNIGVGSTLNGTANTLNNAATLNVASNGAIVDAGDINNLSTGIINFNGPSGSATLSSSGANGVVNDGAINVTSTDLVVTGNLTNNGSISLADGSAGDVLTVNGEYSGTGNLSLDTVLGDDGSATDLLVVSGDTSGTTTVTVNNAGGGGDVTSLGIEIVQVGGSSDGVFDLAGDFVTDGGEQAVVAGAYAYVLSQASDGDWALVSESTSIIGLNGGPMYQPSTPIYTPYPETLLQMNNLPSLRQRLGNRLNAEPDVAVTQGFGSPLQKSPFWVRLDGALSKFNPSQSTTGASADIASFEIQAGGDIQLQETENGRLFGGVTMHYGIASADLSSDFGDGDIKTRGYGFGLTATWLSDDGLYVDGQLQYATFDSDLTSDTLGVLANGNKGTGNSASIEVGQEFAYGENTVLTPQAQLVSNSVEFDTFTGANGERVSLDTGESLKLRFGILVEQRALASSGSASNLYGIGNIYHEFKNDNQVDVSGVKLMDYRDDWSAEIGLGSKYSLSDKFSAFGEVSAMSGLDNFGDNIALKASLGLNWTY